jgi:hypothetical protein
MAFVNKNNDATAVGSTLAAASATYPSTPTQGSLMIAGVGNTTNTTVASTQVSDSNGNWILLGSLNTIVAGQCIAVYGQIASASQPKVINTANAGAKNYLNIHEFSGPYGQIASIIDNAQAKGGADNTAVLTSNGNGAQSVTTTNNNDLIYSMIFGNGTFATLSPAWTGATQLGANTFMYDAYQIETSTGTYTPYMSWSTTTRKFQQFTIAFLPDPGTYSQSLSGTISSTGAHSKTSLLPFSTPITSFAGAINKTTIYPLLAAITSTGSFIKNLTRTFTGVMSSTGNLNSTYIPGVVLFFQNLTAGLSFAGATSKSTSGVFTAQVGLSGVMVKALLRKLTATLSQSAFMTKAMQRFFTASFQAAATFARNPKKSLVGQTGFTGQLARRVNRAMTGVLALAGAIGSHKIGLTLVNLTANLSLTGTHNKTSLRSLHASLSWIGSLLSLRRKPKPSEPVFVSQDDTAIKLDTDD